MFSWFPLYIPLRSPVIVWSRQMLAYNHDPYHHLQQRAEPRTLTAQSRALPRQDAHCSPVRFRSPTTAQSRFSSGDMSPLKKYGTSGPSSGRRLARYTTRTGDHIISDCCEHPHVLVVMGSRTLRNGAVSLSCLVPLLFLHSMGAHSMMLKGHTLPGAVCRYLLLPRFRPAHG